MINKHSPDEYTYETENARLLMAPILPKINLDPKVPITEDLAMFLYTQITHRPTSMFSDGRYVYVPMYNLPQI